MGTFGREEVFYVHPTSEIVREKKMCDTPKQLILCIKLSI